IVIGNTRHGFTSSSHRVIWIALSIIAGLVIFVVIPGLRGWSPGKALVGIRLVNAEGSPPGILRAFLRYILWIVDGFPGYVLAPLVGFVTAERDWALPAGGGAVAAVQLARLAGECTFLTALGDDELGERSRRELEQLGVRVEAAIRAGKPTRRAFTFLDASAERTITVLGERLHPGRGDALPWDELAELDARYFPAG